MTITIKARYANGQLTPLEPLDLEEGAEVTVSVEEGARYEPVNYNRLNDELMVEEYLEKEGPLLRVLRKAQERQAELPPETWDNIPADLSGNKKHYLYGHPKT